jgi:hypothetical protein
LEYHYSADITSIGINLPVFFSGHNVIPSHPVFLANLKNARVWGRNGAVVSSSDHFLEDVSREFNKGLHLDHSIFYTLKQVRISTYNVKTAVVGTAGANVYYHWMMDILPRLGLITEIYPMEQINYFVTEFTHLSFQKETLKKNWNTIKQNYCIK